MGIRFHTRLGLDGRSANASAYQVEGAAGDAQLVECDLCRQMRSLDDLDDLELLGCGKHHSSSPIRDHAFLSSRFSRDGSATHSFKART